jgi:hypothetical protein
MYIFNLKKKTQKRQIAHTLSVQLANEIDKQYIRDSHIWNIENRALL